MSGRKIIKRACDGCKIRKVKCSELPPCDGCIAVGIACTFKKDQRTRGPRRLRPKTIQEIAQTQQQYNDPDISSRPAGSTPPVEPAVLTPRSDATGRTPIPSLVLRLCVYRLRLFPVWPIVAVEEVIASLQRDQQDMETYALANAVGAATIAQLKLNDAGECTASSMEEECQHAKSMNRNGAVVNLNGLRTSFFLHVYHENQEPGGTKSLLYLREAITMAQIMGLHKESSYINLSSSEQQIRRRVLWLLFVTERGVAMLHKLPVILKPNILFPSMDGDDESRILPAFQKLANLFWIFDQSGAFDILQNSDTDMFDFGEIESASRSSLGLLQKKLQEVPIDWESSNDVQKADICVTRQWMRAVLWRVSMKHGRLPSTPDSVTSLSHPIQIAKEFLGLISQLPNTAIEAHGPSMEFKIYEIASAVTDAVANKVLAPRSASDRPRDILNQLQRILASVRGGNKTLISMLCAKIAQLQDDPEMIIEPSSRVEELDDQWSSESNKSPEAVGQSRSEGTGTPPVFPQLQPEPGNINSFYDGGTVPQTEYVASASNFDDVQQQMLPQEAWNSDLMDNWASLSPSRDLYQQLRNFDGSFNNVESSGTLDRLLSNSDLWDNIMGEDWMNILPGNSVFTQR